MSGAVGDWPAPDPARIAGVVTVSFTTPAAVLTVLGVAVSVTLAAVVPDHSADDGAASMIALFAVPMVVVALWLCIIVPRWMKAGNRATKERLATVHQPGAALPPKEKVTVPRGWMWWLFCVLPVGVLATLAIMIPRDPEYWAVDSDPWMLVWMPIFVVMAGACGVLLYFFVGAPLTFLWAILVDVVRGKAKPSALLLGLLLLAPAVFIAATSGAVNPESVGKFAQGQFIAAILGLPGRYEVISEPLLWVARAMVVGVVLFFVGNYFRVKRARAAKATPSP